METPTPNAEFFRHFLTEELYLISEPQPAGLTAAGIATDATGPEAKLDTQEVKRPDAVPATPAVSAQPQDLPFTTAGGNRKRVAVVFNMMPAEFAKITSNPLLLKILASIQHSLEDVLLVNLTGTVDSMQVLYDALPIDQSILFLAHNHTLVLKHKLKPFQPMSVNGKYAIAGAELSGLNNSTEMKKQFWTGLQAMFL